MSNSLKKIKVGVTGGIGSGKSTICKIFELLDVPSYNSDEKAKELIHSHPILIDLYKHHFGDDIFKGGSLNTKKVAEILFNQPEVLRKIQKVVHPIVRNDFLAWVQMQDASLIINEAAILFEGGSYLEMDFVVTVVAPVDVRISRVVKRSGLSESEIRARMNNQWSDEKKIALSDFVVFADDEQLVLPQVLEIHRVLTESIK